MKLLTVKQVAELLAVKPKTVYDWVRRKKIPYYKINGTLRFDLDEIIRWLDQQRVTGKIAVGVGS